MSSSGDAAERSRHGEERIHALSGSMRAFSELTADAQRLQETVVRHGADVARGSCVLLLLSEDGRTLAPAAVFDTDGDAARAHGGRDAPSLVANPAVRRVVDGGEPFLSPTLLVVALRGAGRALGLLALARVPDSLPFDERDLDLAQDLAACAGLALSAAHVRPGAALSLGDGERIAARLRIMTEVSRELTAVTYDLDRLLDVVARRLGDLVGDVCVIRAVSEDGQWIESSGAAYHRDPALLAKTRETMGSGRQRVGEGITGRVAASGKPLRIAKVTTSEVVAASRPEYRAYLEELGVVSMIALPLTCRGKILGVANLMRSDPDHPYDDDDLHLVESIAEHAALAMANGRAAAAEVAARSAAEDAARARKQAEARFARLSECGIIGILVSDLDTRIVEINDALLHMLGYSRAEILSGEVPWRDLTAPEWVGVDRKALEQLASTGIGDLREKEYIRKDGKRVPVLVGSALLEGEERGYISFVLDLTEQKKSQAALHLAAIVASSDDAIIGKTLGGVVTSWNQGAERLFGYAADEIVGQNVSLLVPSSRAEEEQSILERLAHGEVTKFDTVRLRKNGEPIDVSVTISPVRSPSGEIIGISKVARDITERREGEAALARAKEAAESASRELEAFSYSVAHDLRAPLRGMNGFARILLEDYADKLDAEGRDCLDEIHSNAEKMGALIDALLSLSRVARSDWRPARTDLSALFRASAAECASRDPERRLELVVEEGLFADADPHLARALFDNLVGNAWKFTAGTPSARIELGIVETNGATSLFVRDNGAGFEMAYASKLFVAFQRLHTVAEFQGTGIGLATVQRIVHRHGGRIWAEGDVGRGASFFFTLPHVSRSPM